MGLEGDYGTIHIELGPDITEADADWLTDGIAKLLFTKRRLHNKDVIMSMHTDGPCQTSPHCFGAFLREDERLKGIVDAWEQYKTGSSPSDIHRLEMAAGQVYYAMKGVDA